MWMWTGTPVTSAMARRLVVVSLAATLGVLAGCASPEVATSDVAAPAPNDLIIVGYDREPDSLNPYATEDADEVAFCISEGLTTWNEKGDLVPLLASAVPGLENGLVQMHGDGTMSVSWILRDPLTWQDGEPFTAFDIAFTVEVVKDPVFGSPARKEGFELIDSVETPNVFTAVVHYREAYEGYKQQFWRGALPKHVLAGKGPGAFEEFGEKPLGTGPYKVVAWRRGESLLLESYERYWRREAPIRRIQLRFLANPEDRMAQLRSGTIHVATNLPEGATEIPGVRLVPSVTKGNPVVHAVPASLTNVTPNPSSGGLFWDLHRWQIADP